MSHSLILTNTASLSQKIAVDSYTHTNNLPKAVMEIQDLAAPALLEKCLEGYTQNANECVNSVIWTLCPKRKNHGLTTVNTAVAVTVCIFNEGARTLAAILKNMDISAGVFCLSFLEKKDTASHHVASASKTGNEGVPTETAVQETWQR